MFFGGSGAAFSGPPALQVPVPVPVPVPTQPVPLQAASPFPIPPARATPTGLPIPVVTPSPAVATWNSISPPQPLAPPVVHLPVPVEVPAALGPERSLLESALRRNSDSLAGISSTQHVVPLLTSLASASVSGSSSAFPPPVPRVSSSVTSLSVPAPLAPPVPLLPVAPAPMLGQPQLPLSQSAPLLSTTNVAPALSPSAGFLEAASSRSSILLPSISVPVEQAHPAGARKVTFALPEGHEDVAASSLPAAPAVVAGVPSLPLQTSMATTSTASSTSPSPDAPQLRLTEEQTKAIVPVDAPLSEEEHTIREHLPDYTKWMYPVLLRGPSPCSPSLKFPLADAAEPHVLSPSVFLRWSEEEVASALPATLPPEYVVFGGAKYSGAPLEHVRPPFAVIGNSKRTEGFYEAMEGQRLQFLLDQLELAKQYLRIETRRVGQVRRTVSFSETASHVAVLKDVEGSVTQTSGDADDVAKANIWTAAYFGSPEQLNAVIEKRKSDSVLESTGYVQYRRRQWGLKRAGDTFVLGLGMRGTLLQFAAAAGKLDNVVLLLTKGAKDATAPRLKDILSAEAMQVVQAVCEPRGHARRPNRAPTARTAATRKEVPQHKGPFFRNERVTAIDSTGQSPLRRVGGDMSAAMDALT